MRGILLTSVSVAVLSCSAIVAAEAAPPALPSWTGFYLGVNAGYAWGHSNTALIANPNAPPFLLGSALSASPKLSPRGFIGGGQVGYNGQIGQWVIGGEFDFSGLSAKADASASPFFSGKGSRVMMWSSQFDWLATARLRGGFLVAPNWLVYVTGGLAVTEVRDSVSCIGNGFNCGNFLGSVIWSDTKTLAGGTVGGGIETMFLPGWTARAEYLYAKFGNTTPPMTSGPAATPPIFSLFSFDHNLNLVRLSINYQFHP